MKTILEKHINEIDYQFTNFVMNNRYLTKIFDSNINVERQWPPDRKLGLDRNGPIHTMDDKFVATTVRGIYSTRLVIRVEGIKFEYESTSYLYVNHEHLFIDKVRTFMTEWYYHLENM